MVILGTVFRQVFQKLRRHMERIIEVSKHLTVPWGKYLTHQFLGNIEKLGKFLFVRQGPNLGRSIVPALLSLDRWGGGG